MWLAQGVKHQPPRQQRPKKSIGAQKSSKSVDMLEPKALGACSVANSAAVYAPGRVEGHSMNLLLDMGSSVWFTLGSEDETMFCDT